MKIKSLIVCAVLLTAVFGFGGATQVHAAKASTVDVCMAVVGGTNPNTNERIDCIKDVISQFQAEMPQICPAGQTATTECLILQIQILQAQLQIQRLQEDVATSDWCHTFTKNLGFVNSGTSDVWNLHTALSKEGFSSGNDDINTYGKDTETEVAQFQAEYGLPQSGFFGTKTRARMNSLYGCSGAPIAPASNNWLPIAGDWDGNGTKTIGLYDPKTSIFHLKNSNSEGDANITFPYGTPNAGWLPIAGDWNGDGIDTVGLYDQVSGHFYLRNSNTSGNSEMNFGLGLSDNNLRPIAGDWDGDGIDTVGLYDPDSSHFYLRNANTEGTSDINFGFGAPGAGWLPIAGTWMTDGNATVGLYDQSTSTFYLRATNTTGGADFTFAYGTANAGWLPIAGSWLMGTSTIGLFDPTSSHFYLKNTNTTGSTDISFGYGAPIPSVCTPNWTCGEWSGCIAYAAGMTGTQTRTCGDLNNCGFTDTNTAGGAEPVKNRVCGSSTQLSINVIAPNGGILTTGQTYDIRWISSNIPAGQNVRIDLGFTHRDPTYAAGTYFEDLITLSAPNTGLYQWVVPEFYGTGLVTSSFKVKVSATGVSNYSSPFTIGMGIYNPALTIVTGPLENETYKPNDEISLVWSPYNSADSYGATLLKKSDPTFIRWLTLYSIYSTNTFKWNVISVPNASDYYLRVDTTSGNSTRNKVGYSKTFAISSTTPQPTITVTSPNTGTEAWQAGSTHNITWTGTLTRALNISLYSDLVPLTPINPNANAASGSYSWTIPSTLPAGKYYKILLTDGATVHDYSDNNFTITAQPTIAVTSPNAGTEVWQVGSTQNVTWQQLNMTPTSSTKHLYLYSDTAPLLQIAVGISKDATSYSWTIPSTITPGRYKMYVGGDGFNDYAENFFTITAVTIQPTTCNEFSYSPWGACIVGSTGKGTNERTVTASFPTGCTGGNPSLFQPCTPPLSGGETIGLYEPGSSHFYLRYSNTGGISDSSFGYGSSNGLAIAGDWNGDGIATIGLYNPANSNFYLRNSNTEGNADIQIGFGSANAGLKPIAGDWDGNGTDTIGLYDPATSTFYLRNSNTTGAADITLGFGAAGWTPIVGDWDGNGTDTIGLYSPNSTFHLRNSNTTGLADITFVFETAGSLPIAGDWDGNGTDTVGLYNPNNSYFYLKNANTEGSADMQFGFGSAGLRAKPIAGKWTQFLGFNKAQATASLTDAFARLLKDLQKLLNK